MDNEKNDGRKNNGGRRPGSGRPKNSGTSVNKNFVLRVPRSLLSEAKEKGIKNLSKVIVSGFKKELKSLDKTPRVKKSPKK